MNARPFELNKESAPAYLAGRGYDPKTLRVTELSGGVSNIVLHVRYPDGQFVLKQALPQLRVEQEWFADLRRIFHEASALRILAPKLPAGSVPEILFEDRANYAFAMTAAPEGSETWKARLLRNEANPQIAEQVGWMLGSLMRQTWQSDSMAREFRDIEIFEQLRLDPYYVRTMKLHPDLSGHFERLIESCRTRKICLVHGDWSPKNVLVKGSTAMAIDFEVIHYGDPSFDSAFLLNHLLLKTFYGIAGAPRLAGVFWKALQSSMPTAPWFEEATIAQLSGLLLARMDGKSPAEYIRDPALKARIRAFARDMILRPSASVADVWRRYAAQS